MYLSKWRRHLLCFWSYILQLLRKTRVLSLKKNHYYYYYYCYCYYCYYYYYYSYYYDYYYYYELKRCFYRLSNHSERGNLWDRNTDRHRFVADEQWSRSEKRLSSTKIPELPLGGSWYKKSHKAKQIMLQNFCWIRWGKQACFILNLVRQELVKKERTKLKFEVFCISH